MNLFFLGGVFEGALIGAGIGAVVALIIYIAIAIGKKSKAKQTEEDKKKKAEAAAKAELERKIAEEKAAAEAFKERRSVDMKTIEDNRRVPGASAVTGKDNIVK